MIADRTPAKKGAGLEPITLDPKTLRTLDRKRAMTGESRADFVRRLIEESY